MRRAAEPMAWGRWSAQSSPVNKATAEPQTEEEEEEEEEDGKRCSFLAPVTHPGSLAYEF